MTTQRIESDHTVMMGKPIVDGTRITVEQILEELGAGTTIEQLLRATHASPVMAFSPLCASALRPCGPTWPTPPDGAPSDASRVGDPGHLVLQASVSSSHAGTSPCALTAVGASIVRMASPVISPSRVTISAPSSRMSASISASGRGGV